MLKKNFWISSDALAFYKLPTANKRGEISKVEVEIHFVSIFDSVNGILEGMVHYKTAINSKFKYFIWYFFI
jgi:hypothetical protein